MFSNVGWGEILVLFILGLILIGPERLPKVIEDVRALLLAARTAINDARDNLSDEFGEDFDDLRKPLQELNDLRRLNPKTPSPGRFSTAMTPTWTCSPVSPQRVVAELVQPELQERQERPGLRVSSTSSPMRTSQCSRLRRSSRSRSRLSSQPSSRELGRIQLPRPANSKRNKHHSSRNNRNNLSSPVGCRPGSTTTTYRGCKPFPTASY